MKNSLLPTARVLIALAVFLACTSTDAVASDTQTVSASAAPAGKDVNKSRTAVKQLNAHFARIRSTMEQVNEVIDRRQAYEEKLTEALAGDRKAFEQVGASTDRPLMESIVKKAKADIRRIEIVELQCAKLSDAISDLQGSILQDIRAIRPLFDFALTSEDQHKMYPVKEEILSFIRKVGARDLKHKAPYDEWGADQQFLQAKLLAFQQLW